MKGLARRLVCLYPRPWRVRYRQEFEALLEDSDVLWRDVFGIIAGALRLRIARWTGAPSAQGGIYAMDETTGRPRLVDLVSRDIPNGYELETAVEFPRPGGSTLLVRSFYREVDRGDSYVSLSHSARGSQPAQTILVSGVKGEIDGDFRTDRTEMLVFEADGSVRRTEQTVKTWLKGEAIRARMRECYRSGIQAGLTPDQVLQSLRTAASPETTGEG